MYNFLMPYQFPCPACGGLLDYPSLDVAIQKYDVDHPDDYDASQGDPDPLTVICDWCKKRVEVPLEPPTSPPPPDPLKEFDEPVAPGAFHLWPETNLGRLFLVLLAVWLLVLSVLTLGYLLYQFYPLKITW
jgi:hypothetical protein